MDNHCGMQPKLSIIFAMIELKPGGAPGIVLRWIKELYSILP